ncbi:hypothetical protein COTS27_00277 [Spirochaetota bacterium]|nr:hypothetical protein COTS27_00277 [Spirochaetota bacterium]
MKWMSWTVPTALFFIVITTLILIMIVWEIWRPSKKRKGFLPLATHRGDRFFIALLSSAYIHLLWLFFLDQTLWYALGVSIAWSFVLILKG